MEWFWIIVVIAVIIGPIIGGVFHTTADTNRFASLGDIRGMPLQKIIEAVGQPTSISATPEGSLYQWQKIVGSSGYHYAILVDQDENAIGFTHQQVS